MNVRGRINGFLLQFQGLPLIITPCSLFPWAGHWLQFLPLLIQGVHKVFSNLPAPNCCCITVLVLEEPLGFSLQCH